MDNKFYSQTFRSFKILSYRIYFISLLAQMAALNMQIITQSLLVYRITGSATILGVVSMATAAPILLLSLFGGVIADRVQKKYVLFYGNVISVVISLGVGILLNFGLLSTERADSWWILVIVSLMQGIVSGLTLPSRYSIIIEIVGAEDLMNATSLRVMGMNLMQIFAPALAGFLIDCVGFELIYYIMAVLFGAAAALISFMPHTKILTISDSHPLSDLKDGFIYLKSNTTVLIVLCFLLFGVILSLPYQSLMPIFADSIFNVGAKGLGVLMSMSGIGAIIGSIILSSLANRKRGLLLLSSSLCLGLFLAAFSFSSAWFFSLIMISFVGLTSTARLTLGSILVQYYTDEEYVGRVLSFSMMEYGLISLGTFIAGLLAEYIGVQWALGGFGIILAVSSILAAMFFSQIRDLD